MENRSTSGRNRPLNTLKKMFCYFVRDAGGATAILFSLLLPVLMGALGLGVETGYWYLQQSKLQNVADVSVRAAGLNLRQGGSLSSARQRVLRVLSQSGVDVSKVDINLHHPPISGQFKDSYAHLEIELASKQDRMITAVLGQKTVNFKARAVAQVETGQHLCALSLSEDAEHAIDVRTGSDVELSGCGIATNSTDDASITVSELSASLSAECVHSSGSVPNADNMNLACGRPVEYASRTVNPYRDLPEPSVHGIPCRSDSMSVHGRKSLFPVDHISNEPVMRICQTMTISGPAHFSPGIYVFDGGDLILENGAMLNGSEVSLFFKNDARIVAADSSRMNLRSPTSGPFKGVLLSGSRFNTATQDIFTAPGGSLQGAIYFPGSKVRYSSGAGPRASCVQLVANRIEFHGVSKFNAACVWSGRRDLKAGNEVALVE